MLIVVCFHQKSRSVTDPALSTLAADSRGNDSQHTRYQIESAPTKQVRFQRQSFRGIRRNISLRVMQSRGLMGKDSIPPLQPGEVRTIIVRIKIDVAASI